jgi:hypothetical protein
VPQIPNKIKYTSGISTLDTIKVKNFGIGMVDGGGYGPTSVTNFWMGISPPTSGYIIYGNKATFGPVIYGAQNDAELIEFAKKIVNPNITNIGQALSGFITGATDTICVNRDYESIVTSGMVMNLDAGYTPSYPKTGTIWYDLSYSGNNGTLINGPTYSSDNGGSIVFDGVDDYVIVNSGANILSNVNYTKTAWFYVTNFATANNIISSNGGGQHAFWLASGNKLNAGHNGAWSTVVSTTTLSLNTWYFGAVTFSTTSGWKLYLNGVQESTSVNTTTFTGIGDLSVGSYWSNNFFTGRISIGQIYNRILSASEILQNYDAQKSRYVSSVDPDAQAFITAAGITDPTQQSAINTLVVDLKSDGLWTKMIAIYPLVGGTASSQKYNLKDPRDLDVAYRLTFYGGWVHDSNGITGNFTNTFADTYIVNYNLGQVGMYTTNGNIIVYGGRYALNYQYDTLYYFPNISFYGDFNYEVGYFVNSTDGSDIMFTFDGYLGLTTISGGDGTSKQYHNGNLIANINPVAANPSPLSVSLWFGAVHTGFNMIDPTFPFYSDGTFAFAFVTSSTLDSTENSNLYSIVQAYQTTLGRAV